MKYSDDNIEVLVVNGHKYFSAAYHDEKVAQLKKELSEKTRQEQTPEKSDTEKLRELLRDWYGQSLASLPPSSLFTKRCAVLIEALQMAIVQRDAWFNSDGHVGPCTQDDAELLKGMGE